jgi:hypothetical protein
LEVLSGGAYHPAEILARQYFVLLVFQPTTQSAQEERTMASDLTSSAVSFQDLATTPGVKEFLEKHDAEKAFRKVVDLVHVSFPEVMFLRADLQPDPDEEDRASVILYATLPSSQPVAQTQAQNRNYHEQLVRQVPLSLCPLFGLVLRFTES